MQAEEVRLFGPDSDEDPEPSRRGQYRRHKQYSALVVQYSQKRRQARRAEHAAVAIIEPDAAWPLYARDGPSDEEFEQLALWKGVERCDRLPEFWAVSFEHIHLLEQPLPLSDEDLGKHIGRQRRQSGRARCVTKAK